MFNCVLSIMKIVLVFVSFWISVHCSLWKDLPSIPTGSRAEYYLQLKDGGYKYGYDTGTGISAKQNANAANEVKGQFGYPLGGQEVNVKYSAGVNGFIPEVSTNSPNDGDANGSTQPVTDKNEISDASYSFSYSAGDSTRSESSDPNGNVQGEYAYKNEAGEHDLSYKAGDDTGFIVTGGSLAIPNGLVGKQELLTTTTTTSASPVNKEESSPTEGVTPPAAIADASYSFSYASDDQSRSESSDSAGNVEGQYAYKNEAGEHDLSYKAGDDTGFIVTGGSLAIPNGLVGKQELPTTTTTTSASPVSNEEPPANADEQFVPTEVTEAVLAPAQSEVSDSPVVQLLQDSTAVLPLKVFLPFNGLSVIKLLPVEENSKVGYILS